MISTIQIDEHWTHSQQFKSIHDFLMDDPGRCYFILLGLRDALKTFKTLWIEINDDNQILAVLFLRHSGNLQFYARPNFLNKTHSFDTNAFISLLHTIPFLTLIGPKSVVTPLIQDHPVMVVRPGGYLATLRTPVLPISNLDAVGTLKLTDLPQVISLYEQVFKGFTPKSMMVKKLEENMGRGTVIIKNHHLISVAQTDFETNHNCVIVGVATDPTYQGQGYARRVLTALCQSLQNEHITPCLIYDNPDAGILYRQLGFVDEDQILHVSK